MIHPSQMEDFSVEVKSPCHFPSGLQSSACRHLTSDLKFRSSAQLDGAWCSGPQLCDTSERTAKCDWRSLRVTPSGQVSAESELGRVCDRAAPRAQNKTDTRTRETVVTTVTTLHPRTVTTSFLPSHVIRSTVWHTHLYCGTGVEALMVLQPSSNLSIDFLDRLPQAHKRQTVRGAVPFATLLSFITTCFTPVLLHWLRECEIRRAYEALDELC